MMTEHGTRKPGPVRWRWPRSPPRRLPSAKLIAAAKFFHAPLAGRGEDNNPRLRPGQTPEPAELGDDAPETT